MHYLCFPFYLSTIEIGIYAWLHLTCRNYTMSSKLLKDLNMTFGERLKKQSPQIFLEEVRHQKIF